MTATSHAHSRLRRPPEPETPRLRLDTSIPIVALGAIALQAAAAIWWAAAVTGRIEHLEMDRVAIAASPAAIARIDERSKIEEAALGRIEARLDHMETRR